MLKAPVFFISFLDHFIKIIDDLLIFNEFI